MKNTMRSQRSFDLMKKGSEICKDLRDCLKKERTALIEFQMDALLENNLRKENLLSQLLETRKDLETELQSEFGVKKPREVVERVEEGDRSEWELHFDQWTESWEQTRERCQANQEFIKHSLKNLGMFADHFKKLLGVNSVYSNQGKEVDIQTQGKVVEAEY